MPKRYYVPSDENFEPIPSTGGKYEMTKRGTVRNAKTRRILRPDTKTKTVAFSIDGKKQTRSISSLKWEVFGILPRHKSVAENKRRVWVKQGILILRFESFRACSRFLAQKTFYSQIHIRRHLARRVNEFAGYEFIYPDEEK